MYVPPETLSNNRPSATASPCCPIVEAVQRLYGQSTYPALRRLTCDYHEGVLRIHGRVPSYYLKQLAQTIVLELNEVEEIVNRAEVTDGAFPFD